MTEYENCPLYEIGGRSAWDTLLYKDKEKMLAKLSELLDSSESKEFVVRFNPEGKLIVGFDEDIQGIRRE